MSSYISDIKHDADKLIDQVPSVINDVLPKATEVLTTTKDGPAFDGIVNFARELPLHILNLRNQFTEAQEKSFN